MEIAIRATTPTVIPINAVGLILRDRNARSSSGGNDEVIADGGMGRGAGASDAMGFRLGGGGGPPGGGCDTPGVGIDGRSAGVPNGAVCESDGGGGGGGAEGR